MAKKMRERLPKDSDQKFRSVQSIRVPCEFFFKCGERKEVYFMQLIIGCMKSVAGQALVMVSRLTMDDNDVSLRDVALILASDPCE